jgi:hypothetical protein
LLVTRKASRCTSARLLWPWTWPWTCDSSDAKRVQPQTLSPLCAHASSQLLQASNSSPATGPSVRSCSASFRGGSGQQSPYHKDLLGDHRRPLRHGRASVTLAEGQLSWSWG